MKRRLSELLFGIAALSSLCSCETKPITDDYDIVKRDCLKEEKIAQLTPTISAKAFDSISVYPSWEFVEPLFFTKDCPFTKSEINSFSQYTGNYTRQFIKKSYQCEGTELYSYSKKEKISNCFFGYHKNITVTEGTCAAFYVAGLIEYKVTPKDGRKPFTSMKNQAISSSASEKRTEFIINI